MENIIAALNETTSFLIEKGFVDIDSAIVLGTGLGKFTESLDIEQSIPYHEIPNFPLSTVEFHKGQMVLGRLGEKKIMVMQGRFHFYEGYSMQQITFPIRVIKKLGINTLLLSNAAGGINEKFQKGDLVLIEDHINLQPANPLLGLNDPSFGNRFVDMADPYSPQLRNLAELCAKRMNIKLQSGVYAAVSGPNLETKAEYKYLERIGADLVGMSTVPEVIVANHIHLKCAAISIITDECHPGKINPVNIAEIIQVAGEADKQLSVLLAEIISSLPQENGEIPL